MNEYESKASALYYESLGREPEGVFFAPGRVNLIGEHIDYNGGLVLPCSLSLGTYAAASKTDDGIIRLVSADMEGAFLAEADLLRSLPQTPEAFLRFGWAAYPLGVAAKLMQTGLFSGGFEMAVCGSLPRGSGLSSSASLEVLTCSVLRSLFGFELDGVSAALLSREAEQDCAGVSCGIMDQFVCAMGRRSSAILLDTASLDHSYCPFDLREYALLIMNTKKPRKLAESKYNERRAECEKALEMLNGATRAPKSSLCGFSPEEFDKISSWLPYTLMKRARHAVTENQRTLQAAEALKAGDIKKLGALMNASHDSLRFDYEVTGAELDSIVSAARAQRGVIGARMTGAGFGGCAIALCRQDSVEEVKSAVSDAYHEQTGYCCEITAAVTGDSPFGAWAFDTLYY